MGFYNSDAISGASQKHKHLQLIPAESIRELREDGAANVRSFEIFIVYFGFG